MPMSNLGDIQNIVSTLALIGALIFAGLQVSTANRIRAEQAALAIVQSIRSEGWTDALSRVVQIPASLTAAQIDALDPETTKAIEKSMACGSKPSAIWCFAGLWR